MVYRRKLYFSSSHSSKLLKVYRATDFFFQVVFAATAVTIFPAMAGRTKFSAYLMLQAYDSLIYPVVVHWTWGGGLHMNTSTGETQEVT